MFLLIFFFEHYHFTLAISFESSVKKETKHNLKLSSAPSVIGTLRVKNEQQNVKMVLRAYTNSVNLDVLRRVSMTFASRQ